MAALTLDMRALQLMQTEIVEEQNRRAENILNGAPTSFDEYREKVGFLKGLEFARKLCVQVEKDLFDGK